MFNINICLISMHICNNILFFEKKLFFAIVIFYKFNKVVSMVAISCT